MAEYRLPHDLDQTFATGVGFRDADQPLPTRPSDEMFAALLSNNVDWFATCRWCLLPIFRTPDAAWAHVRTGHQHCRLHLPGVPPRCTATPLVLDEGHATIQDIIYVLVAYLDRHAAGTVPNEAEDLLPEPRPISERAPVVIRLCGAPPIPASHLPEQPQRPTSRLGRRLRRLAGAVAPVLLPTVDRSNPPEQNMGERRPG